MKNTTENHKMKKKNKNKYYYRVVEPHYAKECEKHFIKIYDRLQNKQKF